MADYEYEARERVAEEFKQEEEFRQQYLDVVGATIARGIVIAKTHYIVKALVISHLSEECDICTGYGAESMTIYTTETLVGQMCINGHGEVKVVSEAVIAGLVAGMSARSDDEWLDKRV